MKVRTPAQLLFGSLLILIVALLACRQRAPDANDAAPSASVSERDQGDPLESAKLLLELRGIDASSAARHGRDVIVLYETTQGLEYDDQMAFEWSLIFGAFAPAAEDHVVIVNTAGGRPFASLRAKRQDIDALATGKLDVKGFFDRLEILAIDADD